MIIVLLFFFGLLPLPVSAVDFNAPEIPSQVQYLLPQQPESFGQGLWYMIRQVMPILQPSIAQGAKICTGLVGIAMLSTLLATMPGSSAQVCRIVGALCAGLLILSPSNALIDLGRDTVTQVSDYGKLLLPVMTAAIAAQGGTTTSAALYMGTAVFDAVLGSFISAVLVPMIYVFLCLALARTAMEDGTLQKLQDFIKWLMIWGLKTILYIFTGYMGITGVVSGTTDAAALKAAKLTISGMVPVVGGILSDASESVLVGAGVMKTAAGMYGTLAMLAICAEPFLKIGVQYLMLKATAALCGIFGSKALSNLVQDFSSALGILLGMTGSACLMLLISTVCFMKGVG